MTVLRMPIEWLEKKIIGLDIDEGCLVSSELNKKAERIYLTRTGVFSNLSEFANSLLTKHTGVVIGLPTQRILFRSFPIPSSLLKGRNNKKKDLAFFLNRQNLPFKLEECYWATFILNTHLNLIAAKKEVVEEYIREVQKEGLGVLAVTASLVALYNVFIYNYPEKQNDRFVLLNMRRSASDLLIYEARRLWVYPLSVGKQTIEESKEALERFCLELQRTFNAYYLQNPAAEKTAVSLYLAGQDASPILINSLKRTLGEIEIIAFEPLKKIILPAGGLTNVSLSLVSLSCGLGLTYFGAQPCLKINFIKEKLKQEQFAFRLGFLKKQAAPLVIFAFAFLLLLDIALLKNLKRWQAAYKNSQFQVSLMLPKAKALKAEKEKLQKLQDFLTKSLEQQKLYLEVLAAISQSKAPTITIREFETQFKDALLEVFLSGSSPTYEDINAFLNNLKKNNEDISEAKIVASTFPLAEIQPKAVDFKLRFEMPALIRQKVKASPQHK